MPEPRKGSKWLDQFLLPGRLLDNALDPKLVNWAYKNATQATLALLLTVVHFNFPSYDRLFVLHKYDAFWDQLFLRSQEPFTDHSWLYHLE